MTACTTGDWTPQLKGSFSVLNSQTNKAGRGWERKQQLSDVKWLAERPGRSVAEQGTQVPAWVLKISPPTRLAAVLGGRLGGLEHKGIRSFKGKNFTKCENALFLEALESYEGKGFSLRHESPLSWSTDPLNSDSQRANLSQNLTSHLPPSHPDRPPSSCMVRVALSWTELGLQVKTVIALLIKRCKAHSEVGAETVLKTSS